MVKPAQQNALPIIIVMIYLVNVKFVIVIAKSVWKIQQVVPHVKIIILSFTIKNVIKIVLHIILQTQSKKNVKYVTIIVLNVKKRQQNV